MREDLMKNIKLGCFGYFRNIEDIAEAGYDFIEMHTSEILSLDEKSFLAFKKRLKESPITCDVVNNPFPLNCSITRPEFNQEEFRDKIYLAAERIRLLGAKYWNFGNAYSRALPEGGEKEEAYQKFLKAFLMVCDAAEMNGIIVVLEPLARCLTNNLTTLPAVVQFMEKMQFPSVKTMIDMRWQVAEKRPMEEIYDYAPYIVHAHIDNPDTDYAVKKIRCTPKAEDPYDYTEFLDFAKSESYSGGLSIEANTFDNFYKEIRDAIGFFSRHGISSYRNSMYN